MVTHVGFHVNRSNVWHELFVEDEEVVSVPLVPGYPWCVPVMPFWL